MFELLYSSGLRVGELVALDLDDNPAQGEVTVTGKGSKTRTVPVGAKAREALKAWLDVRSQIATPQEKALFVGSRGARISPSRVWSRLGAWARRRCCRRAGLRPRSLVTMSRQCSATAAWASSTGRGTCVFIDASP